MHSLRSRIFTNVSYPTQMSSWPPAIRFLPTGPARRQPGAEPHVVRKACSAAPNMKSWLPCVALVPALKAHRAVLPGPSRSVPFGRRFQYSPTISRERSVLIPSATRISILAAGRTRLV